MHPQDLRPWLHGCNGRRSVTKRRLQERPLWLSRAYLEANLHFSIWCTADFVWNTGWVYGTCLHFFICTWTWYQNMGVKPACHIVDYHPIGCWIGTRIWRCNKYYCPAKISESALECDGIEHTCLRICILNCGFVLLFTSLSSSSVKLRRLRQDFTLEIRGPTPNWPSKFLLFGQILGP